MHARQGSPPTVKEYPMKRIASYAVLLLALSPVASFATPDATTSFTDHHLTVEKGHAVERVAREMAQRELEDLCTAKGGSIIEITYKSAPIWGGSHPITRVQATAICRVSGNH